MILFGLPFAVAKSILRPDYHWLETIDQIVTLLGFLLLFPLALSVCVNILKGTGGVKVSFRLGAYLLSLNIFYLILLPFYILITILHPPGAENVSFISMSISMLASAAALVIIGYMVVRFIYIAFIGIREIHKLTTRETIVAMIIVAFVVIFMAIVLKIPIYAFAQ